MKKVYTLKDVEEILNGGGTVPADAILTPSAKDAIKAAGKAPSKAASTAAAAGGNDAYEIPDSEYKWTPGADPKTKEEIQKFFTSPAVEKLKRLIVDLGRRSYSKNYNDGNGGNFSVRVGDNIVLCTPTMISKGSMTTEDMCFVDMTGKQIAGRRKRTSEVLAHLAIMNRQPLCKACCHAHPPHATAFALAGVTPPTCVNPETEIFIGRVGLADYGTPGTQKMADAVGEVGQKHDCVFMVNHGVMTWAKDIETAFWKMENVEAHCYTSMLASQIGSGPKHFTNDQAKELLTIRKSLGMLDFSKGLDECKLCDCGTTGEIGTVCRPAEASAPASGPLNPDAEKLIDQITKLVIKQLGGK